MDLNALLQAAMQDPAARDFIGKMMGGAPAPQPQANPMASMARSIQGAARAPAPALSGAQRAVQEQLVSFSPAQAAQPPMPPQPVGGPQGAPVPPPGMPMPQQGGMAPPAPAPGAGGMDLMSMLMGRG